MPRLGHGRPITEQDVSTARSEVAEVATRSRLSFALTPPVRTHDFDLLFPTLQEDEANLLPRSPDTPARLKALGATMEDADRRGEDSPIPAAYTYLGQFIDHDITLEAQQPGLGSGTMAELLDPNMAPLQLADIRNALRNLRTATLDLDSLYGLPAPGSATSSGSARSSTCRRPARRSTGRRASRTTTTCPGSRRATTSPTTGRR